MGPEMSNQATGTPHGSCSSPSGQNMDPAARWVQDPPLRN